MKKQKKIILILIGLIGIALIALGILFSLDKKEENNNQNNNQQEEEEEEEETEKVGIYCLPKNATNYQKELFTELKTLLESETFTNQQLAETLTKNFVAEFYTLSNVSSKDVGGLQYIADDLKTRFKDFGGQIYNYYKYYDKEDLEVTNVTVKNTKSIKYDYEDDLDKIADKDNLNGYQIKVNWTYKDNTNYNTTITIVYWKDNYTIIKIDNE